HFLKRQRVEMLQLRDIEHFLTKVMQESIDGSIHPRSIDSSWQNIVKRALQCCYGLSRVMKWVRQHLFEGCTHTRHISKTSLGDQSINKLSISVAVVSIETLFGTLNSSCEG